MILKGRALTAGEATGAVLKLNVPLSFWGGIDLKSGTIIDQSHPRAGTCVKGRILAMPGARGSSSSSSALVELARSGLAPSAVVMTEFDPILVIGSLVAAELYGVGIPIVLLARRHWSSLSEGSPIRLTTTEGEARIEVVSQAVG